MREIDFYADSFLIYSFVNDSSIKTAQSSSVMSLIDGVKNYALSRINPNDKLGSLFNLLAPAGISALFAAMNMTWIGRLIGIAISVFHIDVKSILVSMFNGIKSLIGSGNQTTSEAVHSVVMDAVQSNTPASSESEATSFFESKSFDQKQKDVVLIKEAIKEIQKTGKLSDVMMNLFSSQKMRTSSFLGTVLSWVARICIAAFGFMVASDAINKFLGRPNGIDGTLDPAKSNDFPTAQPSVKSSQSKFKQNPSYSNQILNGSSSSWIEKVANDKSTIENLLVSYAKDVYSGLESMDSKIKSCNSFQAIVDKVMSLNDEPGSPLLFIPREFSTKKNLVDWFIDEVASKA